MNAGDENPLLDSRFPDVSSKGRGYQLQTYTDGIPDWTQLRKVSIWQTVDALEQEFRERAAQIAETKAQLGENAANAYRSSANAFSISDGLDDGADSKMISRESNYNSSTKESEGEILGSDNKISEAVAALKAKELSSAQTSHKESEPEVAAEKDLYIKSSSSVTITPGILSFNL